MPRKRKTRRPRGSGSVFKSGGQWWAKVSVNGKATKRRAETKAHAERLILEMKRETPVLSGAVSFGEWAAVWLKEVERDNARTTHADYVICLRHVAVLNPHALERITAERIESALAVIDGPRARQKTHIVLNVCLNRAVERRLLSSNPMAELRRPTHDAKEIEPFSPEQVGRLLTEVQADEETGRPDHRCGAVVAIGLFCGLRISECLGLSWCDVDSKRLELFVRHQSHRGPEGMELARPKTKASIRRVPITSEVLDWLTRRKAIAMAEGLAGCPLVFPTTTGTVENKDNYRTRVWNDLLRRCDIPHRGFHSCRHTYATTALTNGVPVHAVAKILGHAKASTTLDMYSHWIATNDDQVRAAMSKAAKAGLKRGAMGHS